MNQIKSKIRDITEVMSFRSSVFTGFFWVLIREHNINAMRNGMQVLIFFFYCEILCCHISERTVIDRQVIALCFLSVFFLFYTVTFKIANKGLVLRISAIMIGLCVIYSIIHSLDPDELMEFNYCLSLITILIMFALLRLQFVTTFVLSMLYAAIFIHTSLTRLNYVRLSNDTDLKVNMSALKKLRRYDLIHTPSYDFLCGQCVLYIMAILTGMYLRFFNSIRRKAAFLKLAQSAEAKMKMHSAVQVQAYWIEAIMPESVKDIFLKQIHKTDMFQLVYCQSFSNVSILFSDIIGFSVMSQNKSAEQLVYLLNDLYNRFDDEGRNTNCEKLTTLGECYYCISGCPNPRLDHAISCIEMGLGMCRLIVSFNRDHREDVSMRVGIHSGSVIAAIVGNHRFRFDVFSNDVTIANLVETSGKPGLVHISEDTYKLVRHAYVCEEGENLAIKVEEVQGKSGPKKHLVNIKTFFVMPSSSDKLRQTINSHNINLSNNELTGADISTDKLLPIVENDIYHKIEQLRQDVDVIQFLQNDPEQPFDVFQYPTMNTLTLMFIDKEVESQFQNHTLDAVKKIRIESIKLALLFDSLFSLVLSILILTATYTMIPRQHKIDIYATIVFLVGVIVTFISAWISLVYKSEISNPIISRIYVMLNFTIVRVLLATFMSSLPSLIVVALYLSMHFYKQYISVYFSLALFALIGNCIFTNSYYFIKLLSLIAFVIITCLTFFREEDPMVYFTMMESFENCERYLEHNVQYPRTRYKFNFTFQVIVLSFLIYYIIRQNEKTIRMKFYASRESSIRKQESKRAKKVAENLLYNIIPEYIFAQIISDKSNRYKEMKFSYADVVQKAGVLFACVSNFFESFEQNNIKQGEMALRLLHKIICTFDNLLEKATYKGLEKIKTINDCYMLASGLKAQTSSSGSDSHLIILMNFAFEIKYQLVMFNQQNVKKSDPFTLKMGYNCGPVTIGIVGKTKPLFDIWGETVTIASRMYSTTLAETIQVPEHVVGKLNKYFEFQYRGSLPIKNKGNINTFFVLRPISSN